MLLQRRHRQGRQRKRGELTKKVNLLKQGRTITWSLSDSSLIYSEHKVHLYYFNEFKAICQYLSVNKMQKFGIKIVQNKGLQHRVRK